MYLGSPLAFAILIGEVIRAEEEAIDLAVVDVLLAVEDDEIETDVQCSCL